MCAVKVRNAKLRNYLKRNCSFVTSYSLLAALPLVIRLQPERSERVTTLSCIWVRLYIYSIILLFFNWRFCSYIHANFTKFVMRMKLCPGTTNVRRKVTCPFKSSCSHYFDAEWSILLRSVRNYIIIFHYYIKCSALFMEISSTNKTDNLTCEIIFA
jgi:hypothetical protein